MGVLFDSDRKAANTEPPEALGVESDAPDDAQNRVSERAQLARDGVRAAAGARESTAQAVLASARHELRSPLQSIQGFAELLESESYGTLSEDQHAFVEHILQGSLELGVTLEACLELAELELATFTLERTIGDLRSALSDAVDHAAESCRVTLTTRYSSEFQRARVSIERAALRRAFHALLTALAAGTSKTFRLDVAVDVSEARVTICEHTRASSVPDLTVADFVQRRRATRSLIWLRLAEELLGLQDGSLRVSDPLDCVEVRLPLSSPH